MKFLLTNDDGFDAPGLVALEAALAEIGEIVVVAPDRHLSGCAHQVTTDRELALTGLGGRRFHLDGTPADCARIGLFHVFPEADWLISGINAGGNLGADLYHSGTVAAAREAALLGRPAIALSRYIRRGVLVDWPQAAAWAGEVVRRIIARGSGAGAFWNVNLPCRETAELPEIRTCPVDPSPLPVLYDVRENRLRYTGNYHERMRHPGTDVDVCFTGGIAVTEIDVRGGLGQSA